MKLKMTALLLTIALIAGLAAGCGPAATTTTTTKADAVAAASITDNAAVFEKSIGKDGKWIICTTKDLVIDKELVLDGDFVNGKKDTAGKDILQRKIALYTQDADRKVTARFTLTAKKLTVKSANGSIEHGTFKGDLYVAVKGFKLVDCTIDGNVYFASEEIKTSFIMDATSKITGKQEVKAG
jgi:hypothetical protein